MSTSQAETPISKELLALVKRGEGKDARPIKAGEVLAWAVRDDVVTVVTEDGQKFSGTGASKVK